MKITRLLAWADRTRNCTYEMALFCRKIHKCSLETPNRTSFESRHFTHTRVPSEDKLKSLSARRFILKHKTIIELVKGLKTRLYHSILQKKLLGDLNFHYDWKILTTTLQGELYALLRSSHAAKKKKFRKNVLENETTHIRVYRTQLLCESCGFRQNYMKGTLSADFRNFRPIFNNPRWLSEHARILHFLIFDKRFKTI